jgi:plastocyanin
MRRPVLLVLVLVALTAAACGGSNKVGDKSLLNVKDQLPKGGRLGAATTTTAPAATTTVVASLGIGRATTTAPPTASTAVRELVITINGDTSGHSQFEPNSATVFTGFPVRWQNNDTVTRSVVLDDGSKRSGDIGAGKSWTTTFSTAGTFHYSDGTRPFAVASVTVVAR